MDKNKIDKYLNKRVEITIIDGSILQGELHKTGELIFKNEPNLYIPRNYYVLINPQTLQANKHTIFRCSHVHKLKEMEVNNGY